jgi:hypothetical protein
MKCWSSSNYIPVRVRIQVQSPENTLIRRGSHKPGTGLVLSFKKVRWYPDKKKNQTILAVRNCQ